MKYLSIKSMVWMAAMVSISLSAQSTTQDKSIDVSNQFTITKVKYQDEEDLTERGFNGYYHLNIAAAGSTIIDSSEDYTYIQEGCLYLNSSGFLEVNLHLPDGHRINGFKYFFRDSSASKSMAQLYKASSSGFFTGLHTIESTGDSGTYKGIYQNLPTPHYVNNAENAYVMRFYSSTTGANQKMCGVRINMTATP